MKHSSASAIKLLTVQTKALRGLDRIPNQPSRPAKDAAKQKLYDAFWATQPSKATIRELIAGPSFEETRR